MRQRYFIYAVTPVLVAAWMFCVTPAFAQEDVAQLKAQIEELQNRITTLEQEKKDAETPAGSMQATQWNPFEEMEQMHQRMNHMFRDTFFQNPAVDQGVFSSQMKFDPNFDVKEDKDGYVITFDMSGFDKDKIDIQINPRSITVQGQQNSQKTEENKNQYFNSQMYGSFIRTIPLPEDADTTQVKTEKEGDQLIIRLPKKNA